MSLKFVVLGFALAGCSPISAPSVQWKCFGGETYELQNGAWVKLDGAFYLDHVSGPMKCAAAQPAQETK